jgi:hypothetical protein
VAATASICAIASLAAALTIIHAWVSWLSPRLPRSRLEDFCWEADDAPDE